MTHLCSTGKQEKVSLILRTSNLLKIRKQLALLLNIDLTKKTPNLRMILLKNSYGFVHIGLFYPELHIYLHHY